MEAWVWWLIWGSLGLFALGVWGFLLYSLTPSIGKIFASLQKLSEVAEKLDAAASTKPLMDHPADNLSDAPAKVLLERKELLEHRRKRKEARARRLIARVKNIKLEGRFKDVR
jgi:hypothetical protein